MNEVAQSLGGGIGGRSWGVGGAQSLGGGGGNGGVWGVQSFGGGSGGVRGGMFEVA